MYTPNRAYQPFRNNSNNFNKPNLNHIRTYSNPRPQSLLQNRQNYHAKMIQQNNISNKTLLNKPQQNIQSQSFIKRAINRSPIQNRQNIYRTPNRQKTSIDLYQQCRTPFQNPHFYQNLPPQTQCSPIGRQMLQYSPINKNENVQPIAQVFQQITQDVIPKKPVHLHVQAQVKCHICDKKWEISEQKIPTAQIQQETEAQDIDIDQYRQQSLQNYDVKKDQKRPSLKQRLGTNFQSYISSTRPTEATVTDTEYIPTETTGTSQSNDQRDWRNLLGSNLNSQIQSATSTSVKNWQETMKQQNSQYTFYPFETKSQASNFNSSSRSIPQPASSNRFQNQQRTSLQNYLNSCEQNSPINKHSFSPIEQKETTFQESALANQIMMQNQKIQTLRQRVTQTLHQQQQAGNLIKQALQENNQDDLQYTENKLMKAQESLKAKFNAIKTPRKQEQSFHQCSQIEKIVEDENEYYASTIHAKESNRSIKLKDSMYTFQSQNTKDNCLQPLQKDDDGLYSIPRESNLTQNQQFVKDLCFNIQNQHSSKDGYIQLQSLTEYSAAQQQLKENDLTIQNLHNLHNTCQTIQELTAKIEESGNKRKQNKLIQSEIKTQNQKLKQNIEENQNQQESQKSDVSIQSQSNRKMDDLSLQNYQILQERSNSLQSQIISEQSMVMQQRQMQHNQQLAETQTQTPIGESGVTSSMESPQKENLLAKQIYSPSKKYNMGSYRKFIEKDSPFCKASSTKQKEIQVQNFYVDSQHSSELS